MKKFLGILFMIAGVLVGGYVCLWMLITGIIDIVTTNEIFKGIIKILLREVVGGIIALILWFIGVVLFIDEPRRKSRRR